MAAPTPKPRGGVAARFTRKLGPLPVWAWAAVILGAYYLWSKRQPASTNSTATTATDATGSSGAQVPSSGQGSAADNLNTALIDSLDTNTSMLDALTSQLLYSSPYQAADAPANGAPTDTSGGTTTAPASQPTTPATTPTGNGASAAHQTQTQAGSLRWGGLTFTTKAAFDSWAKSHGTTTSKELGNHPQARAIYSTLK